MADSAIPPALTPKEWQYGEAYIAAHHGFVEAVLEDGLDLVYPGLTADPDSAQRVPTERLPAVIALANNALPPDSPYKITRKDVAAIAVLLHAGSFARITSPADHPQNQALEQVQQLREKLIALLPPKE